MKIYKSFEYGPQGMTTYDLLNDKNMTQNLLNPWSDLDIMDFLWIYISNSPMLKNNCLQVTPI